MKTIYEDIFGDKFWNKSCVDILLIFDILLYLNTIYLEILREKSWRRRFKEKNWWRHVLEKFNGDI